MTVYTDALFVAENKLYIATGIIPVINALLRNLLVLSVYSKKFSIKP